MTDKQDNIRTIIAEMRNIGLEIWATDVDEWADRLEALMNAAQVMGRVYNDEGQGNAVLNSVGQQLPDGAPLYAVPQSCEDCAVLLDAEQRHSEIMRKRLRKAEEELERYRVDAERLLAAGDARIEAEIERDQLRAELERCKADGWQLVPVEPTKEMIDSAWSFSRGFGGDAPDPVYAYRAMLKSAKGDG